MSPSLFFFGKYSDSPVEEYTALRDQWIRDGEGFLIVYSICNRSTFERVERIIERVLRVKDELASPSSPTSPYSAYPSASPYGTPGYPSPAGQRARIPIVIVANKRDLYNAREVSTDEGRMLALRMGCEFFEASAKQNANVEQAFKAVVRGIKGYKAGTSGRPAGSSDRPRKRKNKGCVIL